MYLAGGGIMAHPGGPAEGVKAIRQAWDAALQGVPLETYANGHAELRIAIQEFGSPSNSALTERRYRQTNETPAVPQTGSAR